MSDAAALWTRWAEVREPFLMRARDAASLTVPSLILPLGATDRSTLPTPFQGLGAQGVNNLASKLLLSLLPPTTPFFRLVPTNPEALKAAGANVETQVDEGLVAIERAVTSEMEVMAIRVKAFEALKHLLVAGNVTLHLADDGSSRVIPLEQYVARRDPMGWLEMLVVKEMLDYDSAPPEIAALVPAQGAPTEPIPQDSRTYAERPSIGPSRRELTLFTVVEWDAGEERYRIHQQVGGKTVPGSAGKVTPAMLPFLVLRYAAVDGEDYGRGMVEEVMGDLVSLEGLTKAIVENAAIVSRLIGLVDPAGAATADDLNNAPNGKFVVGRATDVTYPAVNRGGDMQFALITMQRIEERLQRAFLLNTAVQRNAERVTAEEIRYVAQELESTLGGVFSVLSQEFQLPLVTQVMNRLARERKIKRLPQRAVRPAIVTGIEALGRGQELAKINVFSQSAQAIVGPQQLGQYMNVRNLLGMLATAAGLDTSELLLTQDEVDQESRRQMMLQLTNRLGPDVIRQLGPGVAEKVGLAPTGQPPPTPTNQR